MYYITVNVVLPFIWTYMYIKDDQNTIKNFLLNLNNGEMPSLPKNPSLMDLLKKLGIAEGCHLGMDEIRKNKENKLIEYTIKKYGEHILLITTIKKS